MSEIRYFVSLINNRDFSIDALFLLIEISWKHSSKIDGHIIFEQWTILLKFELLAILHSTNKYNLNNTFDLVILIIFFVNFPFRSVSLLGCQASISLERDGSHEEAESPKDVREVRFRCGDLSQSIFISEQGSRQRHDRPSIHSGVPVEHDFIVRSCKRVDGQGANEGSSTWDARVTV